MDGFINFLKPPGMTSHDAVGFIRRIFHEKKTGHAGTLDPGAAGVLPIAIGKATRLIEYLDEVPKVYRSELTLGMATDSGDMEGKVIQRKDDFNIPTGAKIEAIFKTFLGEISQVPPAYAAIKINGQRACDLVRQGHRVEIPSRQVYIHELKLLRQLEEKIFLEVKCSKGTYIRSLCRDIGEGLAIPAVMSFLVRTFAGGFSIEEAYTPEELISLKEKGQEERALVSIDTCLGHLPVYELSPNRLKAFSNGLSTTEANINLPAERKNNLLRVYCQGKFLGIGHYDEEELLVVPDKVIYRN